MMAVIISFCLQYQTYYFTTDIIHESHNHKYLSLSYHSSSELDVFFFTVIHTMHRVWQAWLDCMDIHHVVLTMLQYFGKHENIFAFYAIFLY